MEGKFGFVPILRKEIRTHPLFESGKFEEFALFLFLLFDAAPVIKPVLFGLTKYNVLRGAVFRSQTKLAEVSGCNRKTIKKRLNRLVKIGDIFVKVRYFEEYKKLNPKTLSQMLGGQFYSFRVKNKLKRLMQCNTEK